jgi:putative FmdB family regulatory protein
VPTYEFRCPNGHDFERFYKTISAAPAEAECPECGAPATRQLSGGAGLLFKGSGFYLTDYGKNAHRKPAPEKKSEKTDGGGDAGSAKPDSASKPETKPESKPKESKAESPKPKPSAKPKSE